MGWHVGVMYHVETGAIADTVLPHGAESLGGEREREKESKQLHKLV